MRIVASGARGVDGSHGSHGIGAGCDGSDGRPGTDGKDAKDILIRLVGNESACQVRGTSTGDIAHSPSSELYLESIGGDGGHGGRGGDGARGYTGSSGSNATQYSSATSGGMGGPGGDGGDGGNGGNGGDGGKVRVTATDNDMDLFMLCNKCPVNGGALGTGGSGGAAGPGGYGGSGGSGCSWTTTTSSYVNGQTTYTTHYHSRSGAPDGPSGVPGSPGRRGRDGTRGRDGSFKEVVEFDNGSAREYDWRYVAHVVDKGLLDCTTEDGIFEPGETCKLWYSILNTGPMPTPKVQKLLSSFFRTDWLLNPSVTYASTHLLQQGQKSKLAEAIQFYIKDYLEPPVNEVFRAVSHMKWSVQVERVLKYFTVAELGQGHDLTIQFPLKSSPTHGPATITMDEEAPLAACVRNICKKAIGTDAGRVSRVHVSLVTDPTSMTPRRVPTFCTFVDSNGVPIEHVNDDVRHQPPESNRFESWLVKFGPHAKEYDRAVVGVELFLGDIHDFQRERRIQRMSVEVQLASYYAARQGTKMLVVTNHETSSHSYHAWKAVGPRMMSGRENNFWNATLHDGLTLDQIVNGSKLHHDLAHGVIVVENNNPKFLSALRSERNANQEFTFDTCSPREVSQALRDHRIGFAVVGRETDHRWKLMPTDIARVPIPQECSFLEKHFSNPDEYWASKIRQLPIDESVSVFELRDTMKRFHFSTQQSWQLVHGYAATVFGDAAEPIRPARKTPFTSEQRIRNFLGWYCPYVEYQSYLRLVRSEAEIEQIMSELAAQFGPEPQDCNLYQNVHQWCTTASLTYHKARVLVAQEGDALYDEVCRLQPQWKFVVVYQLAPHLTFAGRLPSFVDVCGVRLHFLPPEKRPFIHAMFLGRLSVVLSSRRNGPQVQGFHTGQDAISPQLINSREMCYTILKAMPPHEKLHYLRHDTKFYESDAMHYDCLRAALLSDVLEEQASLRRVVWSGPIADSHLLNHSPLLCAVVAAAALRFADRQSPPSTTTRRLFYEMFTVLHYLLSRWNRWHDFAMFHRRRSVLSKAACALLSHALNMMEEETKWRAHIKSVLHPQSSKVDIDVLVQRYMAGFANVRASHNAELMHRVMDEAALCHMRSQEKPPQVVVNRWKMGTPRDRKLVLHKLRTDFGNDGEVERLTTRTEQHHRLNFLQCHGKHTLGEIHLQATSACSICEEQLSLSSVLGCSACRWVVCPECWEAGNRAAWALNTGETTQSV